MTRGPRKKKQASPEVNRMRGELRLIEGKIVGLKREIGRCAAPQMHEELDALREAASTLRRRMEHDNRHAQPQGRESR